MDRRYFRLVCSKQDVPLVEELLLAEGFEFEPVEFFPLARKLIRAPFSLGNSIAAFFGLIYIQDKSSMLPPLCLNPPKQSVVLDLCASPGSKTGMLAQLVGEEGLVIANEPNGTRLATLRQNLLQTNLLNVVTTRYPGQEFPLDICSFDYILLDVPCSGWGTVEKHPSVIKIWTEDKIGPLINLQKKLLAQAASLLLPGGKLVYSTCTTNVLENEAQIEWAVKNLDLEIVPLPKVKGVEYEEEQKEFAAQDTLRIDGQKSDSQGFFIACLQKKGEKQEIDSTPKKVAWQKAREKEFSPYTCLDKPEFGSFYNFEQKVFFLPDKAVSLLGDKIKWQGTYVGKNKKDKIIIHPRLRRLAPGYEKNRGLNISEIKTLKGLISGQSLICPGQSRMALPFYWKKMPLGWLKLKKERCFWSER
ncbi:RsmB/NOP family class I SAM-dependent RNA methyltransferase [Desulfohalobiaceae bacterium Ax17]|uniref:RsmB/NOP family class I SAM-dependent RNA methyltransferase n=1 Tax=Desulfovulcanus ferrireducens TaxID=2831190 RepID=UPI00207BC564|nr:RsmB/NOP family class I SAM-dependent RNA methyltransferase [Desulfovulcanus ferrireducens]MBT8763326.1 RsmB/NOP family class I SAM-dependent RNA methyltransferase [Desulfovulcanus ferrireducens]